MSLSGYVTEYSEEFDKKVLLEKEEKKLISNLKRKFKKIPTFYSEELKIFRFDASGHIVIAPSLKDAKKYLYNYLYNKDLNLYIDNKYYKHYKCFDDFIKCERTYMSSYVQYEHKDNQYITTITNVVIKI